MDKIYIRDLLIRGIVGIEDWEREKKQDILINIVMEADLGPAGKSDKIEDAVNYKKVCKKIIHLVESSSYYLVEKLADEIARLVVGEFEVTSVTVTVDKPGALRFSRSVGVEITRRPQDYA